MGKWRTDPRSAVAYARCGRDEQDDEALVLPGQVQRLRDYAAFRGFELAELFEDRNVPGSVPLEARPGGTALSDWLSRPEARDAAVLVFRLDRLFSSAEECVTYHEAWLPRGIHLHVLDLAGSSVGTDSPAGEMMMEVLRAARDMELMSRQRGTPAYPSRRPREKGEKPLLGEKVVRGYIVPDPVEMHAVKRIETLSGQGKSLRLIAEALDQEGVPTKRRAKGWSKEAIRLILQRVERGEIRSLRAGQSSSEGD